MTTDAETGLHDGCLAPRTRDGYYVQSTGRWAGFREVIVHTKFDRENGQANVATFERTAATEPGFAFEEFTTLVRDLLEPTAAAKGYSKGGANGPNPLYEFVEEVAGGPGHPLGEIIYKARRYSSLKQERDVLKIAAWAFLVWKSHKEKGLPEAP